MYDENSVSNCRTGSSENRRPSVSLRSILCLHAQRTGAQQRAEQIIVLHHGEIRERGTHQELLAYHGLYWKLYKLQYADGVRPESPAVSSDEEAEIAGQIQFSE